MKPIEKLNNKNLISIFDTAREIFDNLEIAVVDDVVNIKAVSDHIEKNLEMFLPLHLRERMVELKKLRQKALEYMRENGAIISFESELNQDIIAIITEKNVFEKFYQDILDEYEKRYQNSTRSQGEEAPREAEEEILATKNGDSHRSVRDKWLKIKRVLDTIYDKLSPLEGNSQQINVNVLDFQNKGLGDIRYTSSTLQNLQRLEIISGFRKPKLSGDIYVAFDGVFYNNSIDVYLDDVRAFKKYRSTIHDLYNFIQKDGKDRFPDFYNKQGETRARERKITITSLKNKKIIFDDIGAKIIVEDISIQLPPHKNEHWLCRSMFKKEQEVGRAVDWDLVYEEITGYYKDFFGKPLEDRRNWRLVYDAMERLNKRIKEKINTNEDLFTWQEKTIRRNY